MSHLGTPVLINSNRAYWLSSIANDVIHSTIQTDTIDANFANISSLFANTATVSTAKFSTFGVANLDVSGMYVSSLRGNTGFLSSLSLASDLSGGVGYVRFSVDASGIQVDGDPIRFDNLVYLTSTINIIQVSTLVDTDIFAQRGFFSSISSGNLSANQVAINQANISSLYVSSIEAYDISGFASSDWSLYPTLNSSIIFQPGFVLSNIGSNIYFAGQNLLADLSGANLWSIYPAQSTILANNNNLTGLSTLIFQDSAKLYSQTGNNLFYNGQPIQYGNASNISQWAKYPALSNINMNTSSIQNAGGISASNLTLTGSNITSGNTFTGSLGVGGTSLVSLATVNSLGQAVVQDLDVGSVAVGLGDVNIYGNLAVPGDNALYVQGGVTFTGNGVPVHGTTIGCGAQVGGFDTIRIDVLPAGGIFQTTTLPWVATSATSASLTAGGILTLAGGSEIEANTSDFNLINTTSGNKQTTLTVGNILSPPDISATSSLTIQNIAGGGIEIQAGGQGSLTGFSTVMGSNLSSINLDVSTINGLPFASVVTPSNILCSNISTTISTNTNILNAGNSYIGTMFWNQGLAVSTTIGALRVNNIQIADNLTGVTNAPNPNQSRLLNFSTVNSFNISTTDLWVSTINGVLPGVTTNTFNQLYTSSLQVSSLVGPGFPGQKYIDVVGNGLIFQNTDPTFNTRTISSLQYLTSPGINLDIFASTLNITASQGGSNGYVRVGGGGANDTFFLPGQISTQQIYAQSTVTNTLALSSLRGFGGSPLKVEGLFEFDPLSGIQNLATINPVSPDAIPALDIGASTINIIANNTFIPSLSSINLSTSALSFSTATSVGSNANFTYPILIDYDQAGNTSNGGVAIAVRGHNYGTGAVQNQIEMGARGNGENYIMSVWPGQNLEDLWIDCTQLNIRDSDGFSTIINENPYGIQTNGKVGIGSGGNIVVLSTNSIAIGGITRLTTQGLSTNFIQTINGNNLAYAGQTQPCIFYGSTLTSAGGGIQSSLVGLPVAYANKDYEIQATYKFASDNTHIYSSTNTTSNFYLFAGGSQYISWTTFGDLPFTG